MCRCDDVRRFILSCLHAMRIWLRHWGNEELWPRKRFHMTLPTREPPRARSRNVNKRAMPRESCTYWWTVANDEVKFNRLYSVSTTLVVRHCEQQIAPICCFSSAHAHRRCHKTLKLYYLKVGALISVRNQNSSTFTRRYLQASYL